MVSSRHRLWERGDHVRAWAIGRGRSGLRSRATKRGVHAEAESGDETGARAHRLEGGTTALMSPSPRGTGTGLRSTPHVPRLRSHHTAADGGCRRGHRAVRSHVRGIDY